MDWEFFRNRTMLLRQPTARRAPEHCATSSGRGGKRERERALLWIKLKTYNTQVKNLER